MQTLLALVTVLAAAWSLSSAEPLSTQTARETRNSAPVLSPAEAPTGTQGVPVQWIQVPAPDRGVMIAAVANAGGGSMNNDVTKARAFESASRANGKPVEAHYVNGGGHSTFFTDPIQRNEELKTTIQFLRRYLLN